MENKDNPHLKLAEMGAETWNRWARTLMDDVAIDKLGVPDEKKQELKAIKPLNDEEQNKLAGKLGLPDLGELDKDASFEGMEIECKFDEFWFPGESYFSGATFSGNANFKEAIFIRNSIFDKATFNMEVSFSKTTFVERANFNEVTFYQDVSFNEATFFQVVAFQEAIFSMHTFFRKVKFTKNVFFNKAIFKWHTDFKKAIFNMYVSFINASFESTMHFKNTTFNGPPNFHNVELHQNTSFHGAVYKKRTLGNEDAARAWRTLKLAMNKIHNHEQELMFFKYEMDAKRVVLKSGKKYISWLFISIYKWVSDYGTSVFRALMTLTALCAVFTFVYTFGWLDQCVLSDYKKGFELSFANLVPFAPTSKAEVTAVLESIKGEGPGLQVVIVFQNLVSTIMLFLIGLALKHRFSIK